MKIGIDFDNTLVDYRKAFRNVAVSSGIVDEHFSGGKKQIAELLQHIGKERAWWALQADVYGRKIFEAKPFDGSAAALAKIAQEGHTLQIVSHKTRYPYSGEELDLRNAAQDWMNHWGISKTIPMSQVHFEDTLDEKIEKIEHLGLDLFVDDLPKVFSHKTFPAFTRRLLFDPDSAAPKGEYGRVRSWEEIRSQISSAHLEMLSELTGEECQKLTKLSDGANSPVFKLETQKGPTFALKMFPSDASTWDEFGTELSATLFVQKTLDAKVPAIQFRDRDAQFILYEWIDGETPRDMTESYLDQIVGFIQQLVSCRFSSSAKEFGLAKEACLAPAEIIRQIQKRLSDLEHLDPELQYFLTYQFGPLYHDLISSASKNNQFTYELPAHFQILSPSDFGLHNTIAGSDGELRFIDLEYFGWDDPTKLVSDFLWHPSMNLSDDILHRFTARCSEIFSEFPRFDERLRLVWPLYGLRWALIVLNPFIDERWYRRKRAKGEIDREAVKAQQINLARVIVTRLKNTGSLFPYGN